MMKRGFTLTEMTVVIAIFSLVIATVYLIFALNQRVYLAGEEMAEITQNGRVILERMTREIRQAKEIVAPAERTDPANEIIFEDGHVTARYHYIHYYRDDNNYILREVFTYCFSDDEENCDSSEIYCSWDTDALLAKITLENPRIIGEYVTTLEFWGSYAINIFITLNKNNQKIDLSTKVFGRNLY